MAKQVKAIVITGYGTNCEMEMAHACKLGGADQVDIVHMSELIYGEYHLNDYHLLNLPGRYMCQLHTGYNRYPAPFEFITYINHPLYDKIKIRGIAVVGNCDGLISNRLRPSYQFRREQFSVA